MPSLEQGQVIEVVKGVFGLSTSPKLWWMKLRKEILDSNITNGVAILQKHYTDGRVDKVTAKCAPDGSITREQIEENRTLSGSLSWLAKQTRPDLQFAVS